MTGCTPSPADYSSADFWDAAPEYGSRAFWRLALKQPGQDDAYGRNLLIIGVGAAGPIRCTRAYAEDRLDRLRKSNAVMAASISSYCGINDQSGVW